jgi:hypothetical protein
MRCCVSYVTSIANNRRRVIWPVAALRGHNRFWCRREDSARFVLSGDTASVTFCSVSRSAVPWCCPVREKLPRGGKFVRYLVAGREVSPFKPSAPGKGLHACACESPHHCWPLSGLGHSMHMSPFITRLGKIGLVTVHPPSSRQISSRHPGSSALLIRLAKSCTHWDDASASCWLQTTPWRCTMRRPCRVSQGQPVPARGR